MDAPAKKTKAERAAEKVAREAARREAIERLKKTAFTAPPLALDGGRTSHASVAQAGAAVPAPIRNAAREARALDCCC